MKILLILLSWILFVGLGSLFFARVRAWLKSLPGKAWEAIKKNWNDEEKEKKKEVKDGKKIVQRNIYQEDGITPVMETVRQGRKRGFLKRVGMLVLAILAVSVFQWTLELFGQSIIFRIVLSGLATWLIIAPIRKYKWWGMAVVPLLLLLIILSIAYLPAFQSTLASAVNWLMWTAIIVFIIEELFNENWYPKSVGFGGIGIIIIVLIMAIFNLFRPHDYYITEGSRSHISVQEKQLEVKAWENLKVRFVSGKPAPSSYRQIPPSLSGKSSDTAEVSEEWLSLAVKNHLPTEYGRIEAVMGKLFFIVYFIMAYAVFMLVAIPEMFGDVMRQYKERAKKQKGKEKGTEGLTASAYIAFDLFGNILHEFIQGRGGKKK